MGCGYLPADDDWMVSPLITIPSQGTNTPLLEMKMWYEFEYFYDKLELYISADDGAFEFADAVVGSKSKGGWVHYNLDLSEYRGSNIKIGFRLKSDGSYHYGGWYIDNVSIINLGDPTVGSGFLGAFLPGFVFGAPAAVSFIVGAVGLIYYSYIATNNISENEQGEVSYDLTPEYKATRLSNSRDLFILWDATNPNVSEQQKQLAFILNMAQYHFTDDSRLMFGVYNGTTIEVLNNKLYQGPVHREGVAPDFPFFRDVATKVKETKPATPDLKPEIEIWRAYLETIYNEGSNGTPESEPEPQPLRILFGSETCVSTIVLTSVEHGLGAAGNGLTELSNKMAQDGNKLFALVSGSDASGTSSGTVASAVQATGGLLLKAAEVVGDAVEENPATAVKDKLCGNNCYVVMDGKDNVFPDYKAVELYAVSAVGERYVGEWPTALGGRVCVPENLFVEGETIKARFKQKVKQSQKRPSGMSLYTSFLDNGVFTDDGTAIEFDEQEADTFRLEHTEILFNLTVSVEWNTSGHNHLNQLRNGFREISNYMYDYTDGQARLDSVIIYDDRQNWESTDVKIYADNGKMPGVNSRLNKAIRVMVPKEINLPRKVYGDFVDAVNRNILSYIDNKDLPTDLITQRATGHELGHYFFGFLDEYVLWDITNDEPTQIRDNDNAIIMGLMGLTTNVDEGVNTINGFVGLPGSEMSNQTVYGGRVDGAGFTTHQFGFYDMSCFELFQESFELDEDGIENKIIIPESRDNLPNNKLLSSKLKLNGPKIIV